MKKVMLEIVSTEARKKLEDQLNAVDSIDQKIGVLLGFEGVVLVLAFNNKPYQPSALLFYIISQLSFIVSILILFFGYRSIRLETGLSVGGYLEEIKELEPKKDLTTFIEDQVLYLRKSIDTNNFLINEKNKYLAYGTIMLLVGLILYILSMYI
jgi:hypothetical protein